MNPRSRFASLSLALSLLGPTAEATPALGRPIPAFSVEDLHGAVHTQRDLTGRWTVILAMTDKDSSGAVAAWYARIAPVAPAGSQMLTFAALDLFALVPTSTILAEARGSTPRERWSEVWLSRDGSLARALTLPDSETPWIFVVDPAGVVVQSVHAPLSDASFARVEAVLHLARAQRPPAQRPPEGTRP